jgi:hypothetical protein
MTTDDRRLLLDICASSFVFIFKKLAKRIRIWKEILATLDKKEKEILFVSV